MGQSTGAIVALNAASREKGQTAPKDIILQSPAVLLVLPPGLVRPALLAGPILRRNTWRGTTPGLLALKKLTIMDNPLDEAAWERSPDRVCAGFTFQSIRSCYALGADTGHRLAGIHQPVLIQYGPDDPLFTLTSSPQDSPRQFQSMLGSTDKHRTWIPQGHHDMLNDRSTRRTLLAQVDAWLQNHRGP